MSFDITVFHINGEPLKRKRSRQTRNDSKKEEKNPKNNPPNHTQQYDLLQEKPFTMPNNMNFHHNPFIPNNAQIAPQNTRNNFLDIENTFQLLKNEIEKLGWSQREILCNNTNNTNEPDSLIQNIEQQQKVIALEINRITSLMVTALSEDFIPASEIQRYWLLKNELYIVSKQLELYELERHQFQIHRNVSLLPVIATLVITKQPFPKSVKQNKPVGGIVVKLLNASTQTVWPCSPIKAECTTDFTTRTKKNPLSVKNNEMKMENGEVVFNDLIFPYGTRKKVIRLKFKMDVQVGYIKQTIESNTSEPIIINTNESQWQDTEGILLKYESFRDFTEVPWYKFCNAFQRRYLIATKQDLQNPIRALTLQDLIFIYNSKFNSEKPTPQSTITAKQYDVFWEWFGSTLFKIRYKRHLCTMWQRGLICGFLKRTEADEILAKSTPGSFILRFSTQYPGHFAISYYPLTSQAPSNTEGSPVHHYLIQKDDLSGTKKTLPDFLQSIRSCTDIIRVVDNPPSERTYQLCSKDASLHEFYSKITSQGNNLGYEDTLILS